MLGNLRFFRIESSIAVESLVDETRFKTLESNGQTIFKEILKDTKYVQGWKVFIKNLPET